jgi:hypothetical protein
MNSLFGQDEKIAAGCVDIFSFGNILQINNKGGEKIHGELTLYDMSGRDVFSISVEFEKSASFALNLSKGIYIARLVSDACVISRLVWID